VLRKRGPGAEERGTGGEGAGDDHSHGVPSLRCPARFAALMQVNFCEFANSRRVTPA
jgi:hypothetical protein